MKAIGLLSILLIAAVTVTPRALAEGALKLTIEKSVAVALDNNTALSISRLQKEQARHYKNEAIGVAFPDLDITATYRRVLNNKEVDLFGESFKLKPDQSYSMNAEINQYIYSGAVSGGYKAALSLLKLADHNVRSKVNEVVADVKIKFHDALLAIEMIGVNEESVGQLKELVNDSKQREEVGLNTAYDTMRFETRLAEAAPELINAKNNYRKAILALLDSMGMNPLTSVKLEGSLKYRPDTTSFDEALARARESRPELKAAAEAENAAIYIARASKSEQYPTLKAFANYNASDSPGFGDTQEWTTDMSVGLRLELNLFDGRERSSRMKRRLEDTHIARLNRERTERETLIDVRTAFDELGRAREFIQSQTKNVEYAKETYRIASVRHREGMTTQLELLDAQLSLTRAKTNYSRSLYEYSVARVKLFRAMGVSYEE